MTPQPRQLKQVEALRKREAPWSVGLSRASHYRWKGRLKDEGLTGLKPRSKRPQRLRGRWPIWLSLRKAGYTLSGRTVGRILAYLEGQGRIERVAGFLARARRGKSQRRPPGYEVKAPGDLVQIDTLSVSLGPGEEVKHFCAVELSTRLPIRAVQVDGGSGFMAAF